MNDRVHNKKVERSHAFNIFLLYFQNNTLAISFKFLILRWSLFIKEIVTFFRFM